MNKKLSVGKLESCYFTKGMGRNYSERFQSFQRNLLGKWIWRLGVEENVLWMGVIAQKYGILEGDGGLVHYIPVLMWFIEEY